MIFGRTDLRTSVSEAKFDAEADFEVRLAMGRPKPRLLNEKRNFRSESFAEKKCLASKNETSGIVCNVFWQRLASVRAPFET